MSGPLEACDWSKLDFMELFDKLRESDLLNEEEFFTGPFHRFLQIVDDTNQSSAAQVGARKMESVRLELLEFCDRQQSSFGTGEATWARARMIAAAWFSGKPAGEYMLEVLDGISFHHARKCWPFQPWVLWTRT